FIRVPTPIFSSFSLFFFFFSSRPPPTSTLFPYTDALPISRSSGVTSARYRSPLPAPSLSATGIPSRYRIRFVATPATTSPGVTRSEEHTSELQSRRDLVCRLLLEKKKQTNQGMQHLRLKQP